MILGIPEITERYSKCSFTNPAQVIDSLQQGKGSRTRDRGVQGKKRDHTLQQLFVWHLHFPWASLAGGDLSSYIRVTSALHIYHRAGRQRCIQKWLRSQRWKRCVVHTDVPRASAGKNSHLLHQIVSVMPKVIYLSTLTCPLSDPFDPWTTALPSERLPPMIKANSVLTGPGVALHHTAPPPSLHV